MKKEDFKTLVDLMVLCRSKMEKYYDVLKIDEVWDDFNKTITFLLSQLYEDNALMYILDEYLDGNSSPLTIQQEDGTVIEYPLNTEEDVWRAMELYRKCSCGGSCKCGSHKKKEEKKAETPRSSAVDDLLKKIQK